MGRSRMVADATQEAVQSAFPVEQYPEMATLDVRHSRRALEVRVTVLYKGDDYFRGHWVGHMNEQDWLNELLYDLEAWLRSHQLGLVATGRISLEQLAEIVRETMSEDMANDFELILLHEQDEVLVPGWFLFRLEDEVLHAFMVEAQEEGEGFVRHGDGVRPEDSDMVKFDECEATTQQACGLIMRCLDQYIDRTFDEPAADGEDYEDSLESRRNQEED